MEEIKKKVIEHDFAIKEIAKSIHDLSDSSKEANKKLGMIAESMGKQELILEKLANLETRSTDNMNRVHKRIDDIKAEIEKHDVSGCTAFQLFREKEKTVEVEIKENIKSYQKRIDKIESTVTWVSRSIIGALLTGAIGILFYAAKG